jgi:4'-phosphopantetheinyl transferase EntD
MKLLEHNLNPKIEILLIENKTDILADELPPLVDIDEFNSFKTDKRRSEHVSARFALGSILEKWGLDVDQMKIVRDNNRAPSLRWLDGLFRSEPLPGISLGHSNGHAVAAVIEPGWWVGIDAEPESRKIALNALDQFCKGEELEMLSGRSDEAVKLWTSKEAVQKSMHLGMNLNPRIITFENGIPIEEKIYQFSIGNKIIQLKNRLHMGFQIAVAWRLAGKPVTSAEDELLDATRDLMRNEDGELDCLIGCVATQ